MIISKLKLPVFIALTFLLTVRPSTSFRPIAATDIIAHIPTKKSLGTKKNQTVSQENKIQSLFENICQTGIDYTALQLAYHGYLKMKQKGQLKNDRYLSVVDFTKPSSAERLFIIDLKEKAVRFKTLVAHGVNTGNLYAKSFSNTRHSNQSSLGFFTTNEVYTGTQGLSLRLDGKDGKFNSAARCRGVVIHGADYVSQRFIKNTGRLGRSFGCPALPRKLNKEIIETIKGQSCFFIYYPDTEYLGSSQWIDTTNQSI